MWVPENTLRSNRVPWAGRSAGKWGDLAIAARIHGTLKWKEAHSRSETNRACRLR